MFRTLVCPSDTFDLGTAARFLDGSQLWVGLFRAPVPCSCCSSPCRLTPAAPPEPRRCVLVSAEARAADCSKAASDCLEGRPCETSPKRGLATGLATAT